MIVTEVVHLREVCLLDVLTLQELDGWCYQIISIFTAEVQFEVKFTLFHETVLFEDDIRLDDLVVSQFIFDLLMER